jgi:site-specific DNA recombinase
MNTAIYARNSTQQQSIAGTTASQIEALKARAKADGTTVRKLMVFSDEGVSGSTFDRPALERLRDAIAAREVSQLYVYSPDRLARNFVHQMVLLEEFQCYDVQVIFLDRPVSNNPEEQLLVQVQGVISEYERAKILERTRRGRLHAARRGSVSVLTKAPFGYRYISKQEGAGTARFEIEFAEAKLVRDMFKWIGERRISLNEVCRKLEEGGHITPTGAIKWNPSTVWGILKNPAYKGKAAFGKTKLTQERQQLRPSKGQPSTPKYSRARKAVSEDEWIYVPVQSLVTEELFDLVQEQLEENRKRKRERANGAQKLLGGLVRCGKCGFAYCASSPGNARYKYYRCAQKSNGSKCKNAPVNAAKLEEAVWSEVAALLKEPQRLEDEYNRRLHGTKSNDSLAHKIDAQRLKAQASVDRLIDAFSEGTISKQQFDPRIKKLQKELADAKKKSQAIADQEHAHQQLKLLIVQLAEFRKQAARNLEKLDFDRKRQLIVMLVEDVIIDERDVNIRFRVGPRPFVLAPPGAISPNCKNRHDRHGQQCAAPQESIDHFH